MFLDVDHEGPRSVMGLMDQESSRRRPFFSSSSSQDELYDEEYYDEQLPEKKRRLTPDQVYHLCVHVTLYLSVSYVSDT